MERLLFYGLVIDRRPEAADRGDDITVCGGGVGGRKDSDGQNSATLGKILRRQVLRRKKKVV